MGGPRTANLGGQIVGERIVYVDSPEVRKKYEEMLALASKRMGSELKGSMDRERLAKDEIVKLQGMLVDYETLKSQLTAEKMKAQKAVNQAASPDDRKAQEFLRIKEELASAYRTIKEMKVAAAQTIALQGQNPEGVIEFKKPLAGWILYAASAGSALAGYLLHMGVS